MPSSTARTARLRSAACAAAGNDRVSSSVIPGAYDTITPFAYRSDSWSLLVVAVAFAALGALLGVLNHFQPAGSVALWFDLLISLALAVPGAVLVGYRPANPIGWILAAMGLT